VEKVSGVGMFDSIIAAAERNNPPSDVDYLDDEGFLVCGKCHTRKQCEVRLPAGTFGPEERVMKVPSMCSCRKAEVEREEEKERKRKEMEVVQKLRKKSLMDEEFRKATLENFREDKYNSDNLKLIRWYATNFEDMEIKNQGLLFYGGVGTGKSFAAACIANYLLALRVPVIMTSFIKLLNAMQSFDSDNEKLLSQLNRARLLIIDDLGAERGSDFALEKVYNIVDSRYRANRPLIITTNLDIKDIQNPKDIRYARIYDRIIQICVPAEFTGDSWRKSEAISRHAAMKAFLKGGN